MTNNLFSSRIGNGKMIELCYTILFTKDAILHLQITIGQILCVFVKTSSGETFEFYVNLYSTITNIEKKVAGRMDHLLLQIHQLIYDNQLLEDCRTLSYYKISHGSVLDLQLPPIQIILIYINILARKLIQWEIDLSNTVINLKTVIQEKTGYSIQQQRFIFNERDLEDHTILGQCKLETENILYLELFSSIHFRIVFNKDQRREIDLQMDRSHLIIDLKQIIQTKENILPSQQRITFSNELFNEYRSISSYNIEDDNTLYLDILFSISVNILAKETITLQVSTNHTIKQIKENILVDTHRLSFLDRQLIDEQISLTQCNVIDNSVLNLIGTTSGMKKSNLFNYSNRSFG